jgi:hypothetical protein
MSRPRVPGWIWIVLFVILLAVLLGFGPMAWVHAHAAAVLGVGRWRQRPRMSRGDRVAQVLSYLAVALLAFMVDAPHTARAVFLAVLP